MIKRKFQIKKAKKVQWYSTNCSWFTCPNCKELIFACDSKEFMKKLQKEGRGKK
ncbi:hypothetical protein GW932_03870 [archaeon]|nr:hypothetical protein [archaeon]